eukprot:TRINITY_DN4330_c2_g2_i1.p1 TRINITY_DN4330_c2_g2~~TRINITY_DN4330_c2_g2_i1.p1  ORF type:complete len:140 (+),score=21.38 TRINITY_DN4330_c2_g2_i1:159-578(+)
MASSLRLLPDRRRWQSLRALLTCYLWSACATAEAACEVSSDGHCKQTSKPDSAGQVQSPWGCLRRCEEEGHPAFGKSCKEVQGSLHKMSESTQKDPTVLHGLAMCKLAAKEHRATCAERCGLILEDESDESSDGPSAIS